MLRDYQKEAVEAALLGLEKQRRGLINAPTGSGKSHIIATICAHRAMCGHVLVLCHRAEILDQNYAKIQAIDPSLSLGMYSARKGLKQIRKVTTASINSIYKKGKDIRNVGTVIIDECHLLSLDVNSMYQTFLRHLRETNNFGIVGLTATPFRTGQGSIVGPDKMFDDVFYSIEMKRLIREGYLSPVIGKSPAIQGDMSKVKKVAGEYHKEQSYEAMRLVSIDAIKDALARATDRKSLLFFCSGVQHCYDVKKTLEHLGVSAEVVEGGTPEIIRSSYYNDFKRGSLKGLISCDVLTTGFDAPNVDCIVMLRPTLSPVAYVQMVGRGMRIYEGKIDCLVLDYAGNLLRFGPVDQVTIEEPTKRGKGEPVHKSCPICYSVHHAATRVCDICGHTFEFMAPEEKHSVAPWEGDFLSFQKEIEMPMFEHADVTGVSYSVHFKEGSEPSLRIKYHTSLLTITEWICAWHTDQAGWGGRKKWAERFPSETLPKNAKEAISVVSNWTFDKIVATKKPSEKFWQIASASPKLINRGHYNESTY